jgi:hypothetical protein
MKTAKERQEEQKREKLAVMRKQVKAGKLVIRQMTAEERKKFPARQEAGEGLKRSRKR